MFTIDDWILYVWRGKIVFLFFTTSIMGKSRMGRMVFGGMRKVWRAFKG